MVDADLSKTITKPVTGLALWAFITATFPFPTTAQLPRTSTLAQASQNFRGSIPRAAYTLGGGDIIHVDLLGLPPQYSGDYQIPADGAIVAPLVGRVPVYGLTLQQANALLLREYNRFLKNPQITVRLVATRPINIFISGEVNRPGSYTLNLTGGAGNNPGVQFPTLIQGIATAGGITAAADIRQIRVTRQAGTASQEVINLNLWELLQNGQTSQDLTVRDGDTIFIPTTSQVNQAEIRLLSRASFATDPTRASTITVVGEVYRPGSYVVDPGVVSVTTGTNTTTTSTPKLPTVTRVIQLAGGVKPVADIRRIQVRRVTKTGTEQLFGVDLWQLLQTGDINQDAILQDGDTIVIPTATAVNPAEATRLAEATFSPDTIQVSVIGEVEAPGLLRLKPNTPLNQAILAAGGFRRGRAKRNAVELVRLNPDGTVLKRTIPVDLAQGINDANNPILRNTDIIVVNSSNYARVTDTLNTVLSPASAVLSIFSLPSVIRAIFR